MSESVTPAIDHKEAGAAQRAQSSETLFAHTSDTAGQISTEKLDSNPQSDINVEQVVDATDIPATSHSRRPAKTKIGDLYDEIEPEYKRLTQGNLDFDELDVNSLLTDWQSLKQSDSANVQSSSQAPVDELSRTSLEPNGDSTNKGHDMSKANAILGHDVVKDDSPKVDVTGKEAATKRATQDDFAPPDVLVTSARTKTTARPVSQVEDDNRPDAAKLEDLKRFAYAHGSKPIESKSKTGTSTKKEKSRPKDTTVNTKEPKGEKEAVEPAPEVPPHDKNLSFSHASKVTKVLGLKRDPLSSHPSQQFGSSARSSVDVDPLQEIADAESQSDEESFFSATSKPPNNTESATPVRRQVSFRRSGSSSSIAIAAEQTAKRALLIKAAHLEVCNHMIRSLRSQGNKPQEQNWSLVGLSGLSFWDRLAEIEKIKSQFTIIEIMRRYSFETQFSDALVDQVQVRDLSSGARETAMNLEPKSDLPLSTDLDNEVGRSKAAAEFIIEKLSAKLAGGSFSDHEDNVFKVPIKDKSPLSRIQTDSEWRLIQDAVSAHALGRGYQVQMGDGPEEITRPWQVRQKEDIKEALLSLKWPSANELIWIKVNRLGIEP